MRTLVALAAVIALVGCATSYGKYGLLGGYSDSRIDANTFSISVDNNGFTSQQTTSLHALYRAAELTAANDFDYFVIVSGANNSTTMAMVMPGSSTSQTTVNAYGSSATASTTTRYAPTTVVPIVLPNSTIVIKTFKGTKPNELANAYDASETMKYLGPQIGAVAPK